MDSKRFETQFFIGLLILASGLMFFIFLPLLNALVLAITFTVLFHPVYSRLQRAMPKMNGFTAILTVLLAVVIILMPLTYFGIRIFQETQGLYAHLASGNTAPLLDLLSSRLHEIAPWLNLDLNQFVRQLLGLLLNNLGLILTDITTVVGTFLLSFFAMYYFLKDGSNLKALLLKNSPLSFERSKEILSKLQNMVTSVVGGMLVVSAMEGFFVGLGFFAFGIPGAVLWGAIAIIAGLVPILGISLVIVPGIITLVLLGNQAGAIGFALVEFTMMATMETFIKPRLIQRKTKIHPLLLLFSIIGGIVLFGATGILLGPLTLILLLALLEIYPTIILDKN